MPLHNVVINPLGFDRFSHWIDLGLVHLLPTYIWPQIVGGLILGVGFVMGGYCPTTSIVATVSGKLDGLIFIVGMVVGSFIFAEIFPILKGFYSAGDMGALRLSDVLHINSGIIALLVCLMAVGAYWFVEKVENKFGDSATLPVGSKKLKRSGAAILILLGLILAIINPDRIVAERPSPPAQTQKKTEEIQKPAPKAEKSSSPKFEIVEDEGC